MEQIVLDVLHNLDNLKGFIKLECMDGKIDQTTAIEIIRIIEAQEKKLNPLLPNL